jgi:6-pyruvoyl-tetrahydropterin synthase
MVMNKWEEIKRELLEAKNMVLDFSRFDEYIEQNELELALDELIEISQYYEQINIPKKFWQKLRKVALLMNIKRQILSGLNNGKI